MALPLIHSTTALLCLTLFVTAIANGMRFNTLYYNEEKSLKAFTITNQGLPGVSSRCSTVNAHQQLIQLTVLVCKDCAPASPPSVNPHKGFKHVHIIAPILISLAVVLAVVAFLAFFFTKKRLFKHLRPYTEAEQALAAEPTLTFVVRRFNLKEMEAATKKFSSEFLIGSGAFGKVYKGLLKTCDTVAIKRANRDMCQGSQEFHNEVKLLSDIRHKNLVSLLGFCEEAGEQVLVYEYMPNGNLLQHITGQKGMPLTWRQRVQIAIGAAKGISHLHDCKPAIIHRDIKPSNILVDDYLEAKVSDFGLIKAGPSGDESYVSSLVKGTPGYLDPHYCSSYHLTTFSDVYSFGVILLQLVTARPAVDLTKRTQYNIIDWVRPSLEKGDVEHILDSSLLKEPYNRETMLLMGQIGLRCVRKSPKERPTMKQIYEELESHLYSHIQPSISFKTTRSFNFKPSISFNKEEKSRKSEEENENLVSLENAGLQKFEIEMESISFDGINMRCLDCNSISIDGEKSSLEQASRR